MHTHTYIYPSYDSIDTESGALGDCQFLAYAIKPKALALETCTGKLPRTIDVSMLSYL